MKKFCSYLRADLRSLLCSVKMILSVALTVVVLLLATLEGIDFHAGVLYVFSLVMYWMPAMVVLICGAYVFADSLCEDAEYNYIRQQIIRGKSGNLCFYKAVQYILSAFAATAFGIFLFANILHFRIDWVETTGQQHYDSLLRGGGLRIFLKNRAFEWYFLCYGLQYGLLSGILSLWASYLSLYISNRMLVLAAPAVLYYFTDYVLEGIFPGRVNFVLLWVLMVKKIRSIYEE